MRDGVRLYTAIYAPRDHSRTWPILMFRTPYHAGPYGLDAYRTSVGPNAEFEKEGFIFVHQDVRGRWMSEGTFENMRPLGTGINEATDTFDTIEWLLANVPGHNGKVGQTGISYPGFYATAGALSQHPALVAVSPQAPIADWFFDDVHTNGAFGLSLAFNFFATFGQPQNGPRDQAVPRLRMGTADGYDFLGRLGALGEVNERWFGGQVTYWDEILAHPTYDTFWKDRNILPHIRACRAAILVVGGWFDAEDLHGSIKTYQRFAATAGKAPVHLVMGPWYHGGWLRDEGRRLGDMDFGFGTAEPFQTEVLLPFFRHYLHSGPAPKLPPVRAFETGANRWRDLSAWPPATTATTLFLAPDAGLRPQLAQEGERSWHADPHRPVPYSARINQMWGRDFMTEDQRFAARRPDVLTWFTEPLSEDFTVAGEVEVELWVSSTATDADWVVKIIDAEAEEPARWISDAEARAAGPSPAPDRRGQLTLVRQTVMPGRFREGFERAVPTTPGEVVRLKIALEPIFHTFKRGNRLGLFVQSSLFPLVAVHPQTFTQGSPYIAPPEARVAATHRVHTGSAHASSITLPALRAEAPVAKPPHKPPVWPQLQQP